ncbi:TPA: polysaccharide biosynthesis C-terminal domain-containing protein [Vibrio parahaemolyticus]|nr:polysaccharide biosynthesis C-terminal domain-containing protein [Vibrio parahaemolyticus]
MKVLVALIALSVVSKFTGLFRELSIGFVFGPGEVLDTFIIVMMVPSIVLDVMSSCINSCYVPIHKKYYKSNPLVLAIILVICVLISFSLSLIVYIINVEMLTLIDWNKSVINQSYITSFSLPASIYIFVCTLNEFFKSILACEDKSPLIPVITIFANVSFIVSIYCLSDIIGSNAIAYSYCIFGVTQMVFGFLFTRKTLKTSFVHKDKSNTKRSRLFIYRFLVLIIPVSIGSITNQVNKSVDKYLASNFDSGSISYLYFSQQLYSVLVGILIVNVVTYYFPKFCEVIKDKRKLYKVINDSLYLLSFISVLIFIIVYNFKRDIVSIVMGYGKLNDNLDIITMIFLLYTSGLIFESISAVFKRVLWANEDTVTPVRISIVGILINVILSVLLSSVIGIYGIVLATVASNCLVSIILGVVIQRNIVGLKFQNWIFKDLLIIFPMLFLLSAYINNYQFNHYENLGFSILIFTIGFGYYLLKRFKFEK